MTRTCDIVASFAKLSCNSYIFRKKLDVSTGIQGHPFTIDQNFSQRRKLSIDSPNKTDQLILAKFSIQHLEKCLHKKRNGRHSCSKTTQLIRIQITHWMARILSIVAYKNNFAKRRKLNLFVLKLAGKIIQLYSIKRLKSDKFASFKISIRWAFERAL